MRDTPTDGLFNGSVDEVSLYNRALAGHEVLDLFITPAAIALNNPPIARDDSFSVGEDNSLSVDSPDGVLFNDTDQNGNPMNAVLVTGTSNGSLVLNPNGSFTYDPNPDFSGVDHLTYRVYDGITSSNLARVNITVNPTPR